MDMRTVPIRLRRTGCVIGHFTGPIPEYGELRFHVRLPLDQRIARMIGAPECPLDFEPLPTERLVCGEGCLWADSTACLRLPGVVPA